MDKLEIERRFLRDFDETYSYNKPIECAKCHGGMVYVGVGEYRCEKCGALDYDDYGKVRNYVETHQGATAATTAEATGVSQKAIQQMLRESKLVIAPNSRTFLLCEVCGASIRQGRMCPSCAVNYQRGLETDKKKKQHSGMTGYSMEKPVSEEGAKRYTRKY